MKKILLTITLLLILPLSAQAANLLDAAGMIGYELDRQVSNKFGYVPGDMDGLSVIVTTPVDSTSLGETSKLGRQMQEALASWLAGSGYAVQEIRLGNNIIMQDGSGETLLTRNKGQLISTKPSSALVLVTTYTVSGRSVYFNVRLVANGSHDIYAMTSLSLPLNGEIRSLLPTNQVEGENSSFAMMPSVYNRLP